MEASTGHSVSTKSTELSSDQMCILDSEVIPKGKPKDIAFSDLAERWDGQKYEGYGKNST